MVSYSFDAQRLPASSEYENEPPPPTPRSIWNIFRVEWEQHANNRSAPAAAKSRALPLHPTHPPAPPHLIRVQITCSCWLRMRVS
jgi:hypothetical protein